MSEVWYREHVEDVGRSDWKVEKIENDSSFYGVCKGMGYSDQQIVEIYEAIEKLGSALKEIVEAVAKAISPAIEFIKETWFENFDFYYPPEKKIYQVDHRLKSNVKNYGYMPNYRGRMFCVGNRGNYRRF